MRYEVEQKFRITAVGEFIEALSNEDVLFGLPVVQIDRYFNHPCRDYAVSDEALRIRTQGSDHFITYKGPKIDAKTKTRQEIELPIGCNDDADCHFNSLFLALGFHPVAVIRKKRKNASMKWEDRLVTISVDEVENMGVFVELELSATEQTLNENRRVLQQLAEHLNLKESIRASYLEMMLEQEPDTRH